MSGYTTKGIRVLLLIVLLSPCFSVLRCYADNSPAIGVEIADMGTDWFYMADSKSWLPYRFIITGTSGDVTITAGTVEFYLNEVKMFSQPLSIEEPGNTYKLKPSNGQGVEYLAVIDEALFDMVSTSGLIMESAELRITGFTGSADGKSFGPISSKPMTSKFGFGDKSIKIIELGKYCSIPYNETVTRQNEVDHYADCAAIAVAEDPPKNPLPYDISNWPGVYDFDHLICGYYETSNGYVQESQLGDTWPLSSFGSGVTAEARVLDMQCGVYFYVYYNQVPADADGNVFNRPVVGTVENYGHPAKLFHGAQLTTDVAETGPAGVQDYFNFTFTGLKAANATCFIAGAPATAALKGATLIVGALKAVCDYLPVADHPDATTASSLFITEHSSIEGSIALEHLPVLEREQAIKTHTLYLNQNEQSWEAKNWWRFYLTTSTTVRCKSRPVSTSFVKAKIIVDLGDKEFLTDPQINYGADAVAIHCDI